MSEDACRLNILFARETSRAVIFRRGPSKWTQLILWYTDNDRFVYGQWFKGRIYERRCDLSPDGTKLIYFASKFNRRTVKDAEYTYAWTAISKPPYFTALALWPKGDCWHGEGLFEDDQTVWLNHRPERAEPHPKHRPQGLLIKPNPEAHGEDGPVVHRRWDRDGWQIQQEGKCPYTGTSRYFVTEVPEIRVRRHASLPYQILLTSRLDKLSYSESFAVTNRAGRSVIDARHAEWVDWDQRGRLVILREGKLFIGSEDIAGISFRLRKLADFNASRPEEITSPGWARKW